MIEEIAKPHRWPGRRPLKPAGRALAARWRAFGAQARAPNIEVKRRAGIRQQSHHHRQPGPRPKMRTFPSGDRKIAHVTIATTDKWKDKQTGEMKEATKCTHVASTAAWPIVGPIPAQGLGSCMWKAACAPASGPTRPVWRNTAPKSVPPDADAGQPPGHGRPGGGQDERGYSGDAGGGHDQAPRRAAPAPVTTPAAPPRPGPRPIRRLHALPRVLSGVDDDIPF